MFRLILVCSVSLLICACAGAPAPGRWVDRTGAGRTGADLERDSGRCRMVQGGATIDPRERLRADDCSTIRATTVSCTLSDNARRTEGDNGAFDACMRTAGWVREPDPARGN